MQPAADEVVRKLLTVPARCTAAEQPAAAGGVPALPGLYAWWADAAALDSVPIVRHPVVEGTSLLYVGISPARRGSRQSLRGRIVGNHLRGNTGSSTFRLTLAALLFERQGWRPIKTGSKTSLTAEDNRALSLWQVDHLALTWAAYAEPWAVERAVIERMRPPLNLAANASGDLYDSLRAARRRFRAAAISPSGFG